MNIAVKLDAADARRRGLRAAARRAQSGPHRPLPERHHLAGVRAAAARGSGPLHAPTASSAPIGRSPSGTTSWRWTPTMRPSPRPRASAWPTCEAMEEQEKALSAMGREPRRRGGAGFITMDEPEHSVHRKAVSPTRGAGQHRHDGAGGARARRPDPRFPADRRGVRLGRPGVEGADGDDAGHPVRLPVRGAPQAALLVGHGHEPARPRAGGELATEGRGR